MNLATPEHIHPGGSIAPVPAQYPQPPITGQHRGDAATTVIVGQSPAFQRVQALIAQVAPTRAPLSVIVATPI